MLMYGIAMLPFIKGDSLTILSNFGLQMTQLQVRNLKSGWGALKELGPEYGYFPNASKTKLIVKRENLDFAERVFYGKVITISAEGHKYLRCPIGSKKIIEQHVLKTSDGWISELESLSHIPETQPHCDFAAFTHSFIPKWNYMMRVIDCSQD